MGRITYSWVTMNEGSYVEDIAERISELFEILICEFGVNEDLVQHLFISSGIAREMERQNVAYAQGKSGLELAIEACEACGVPYPHDVTVNAAGWSVESWAGRLCALFQVQTGCPYYRLLELVSFPEIRELFYSHEEETPEEQIALLKNMMRERGAGSKIKEMRELSGLTQSQLAQKAGTSLRSIQQYEQGVVSINNASAAVIYRMSMVLNCTITDLLDPLGL